ncbi:hypothetical protein CQW23_04463 [Capsicum baccatum]|uniref:DUF1985 domain-containing protein n=1 Tax=Capsicum baccatum TaxID=33114 RepID=A0A2G2XES1_CAPBA|nr:hypothetical protein CQW23_04463 [Capsicum baccatum]
MGKIEREKRKWREKKLLPLLLLLLWITGVDTVYLILWIIKEDGSSFFGLNFGPSYHGFRCTVEDIPLEFVPATFDEQDPDWAENRSKHRNDLVTMKKLRNKAASKSKKSTSKISKKKFDYSGRPRLSKGMKYRIDKVPPHPLHMGSLCNYAFREEIKEYFGEDVLGAFRNTIFDIFLNLPRCNWIGQISKCLLMLEIHQDNKDELHVWVQGEILKFTMLEFNIITSLKCTGAITRSKLITRVQMGNFDNAEDALNLAILFFVHTFMFSQHKEAPISVANFQIIKDGRYIHFPWGKHLYKNIQPTIKEVSRLDLSFSKDFETYDPTIYASTSDCGNLKRTADELQQRVGTIAKEFGDFSTIPPRKILIKVDFASPVSPDQPLKKRKTVMFEQDNQAVIDDDTSGRDQAVHHISDLYSETHMDATDTGEIGTSKSTLDGDEIKNYINKCIVRVIYEDKIDEQQQSQEDGSNKQERPHKEDMQHEDYYNGSLNDMKVSRDEESNKQHILEEQQLLDMNAVDKEAGHEDDFENEDCSNLQALEDEIMAYEEECSDEELGKKNIPDVEDLSVFDAVDFDKEEKLKYAFDGYTINQDLLNELMIDYSQWIVVGLLKTHSAKDYGIFVCAYAEILSEGLQVHSYGFHAASQRARYASLLWYYGVEKANEGYTSDNEDPPQPNKSVIEEIDASVVVTLE